MMAVDLAVALHERGIRSSVLALNEGGRLEARLRAAGVGFHLVGNARYLSPATHLSVARTLRQLRPTVLHTHHLPSLLNVGPYATVAGSVRIVHTEHARMYLDEQPRARPLLRAAATMAAAVVLVGNALRAYYVETVGLPEAKLRVVVNGVDTQRFSPAPSESVGPARRAAGLPDGRVLVGAVGRLAAVKNYALLIRAFARVRAESGDVALVLVGDGEEREQLEQLTRDLGVGQDVTFLGWRTDVASLIPLFDVLAVSSISEALPLVVLEAMSAAVPVVSTAVGEIPKVIADGAGVVVPPDDVDAFAGALRRVVGDAGLRRELGTRARARVLDRYGLDAMADAYLSLYGLRPHRAA